MNDRWAPVGPNMWIYSPKVLGRGTLCLCREREGGRERAEYRQSLKMYPIFFREKQCELRRDRGRQPGRWWTNASLICQPSLWEDARGFKDKFLLTHTHTHTHTEREMIMIMTRALITVRTNGKRRWIDTRGDVKTQNITLLTLINGSGFCVDGGGRGGGWGLYEWAWRSMEDFITAWLEGASRNR